jgi:hypothetical protein
MIAEVGAFHSTIARTDSVSATWTDPANAARTDSVSAAVLLRRYGARGNRLTEIAFCVRFQASATSRVLAPPDQFVTEQRALSPAASFSTVVARAVAPLTSSCATTSPAATPAKTFST